MKPLIADSTTTDGRNEMRAVIANTEWIASERDGAWEVQPISGGPIIGGLSKSAAEGFLIGLEVLTKKALQATKPQPKRGTCPVCRRPRVALDRHRGLIGYHKHPGAESWSEPCAGMGKRALLHGRPVVASPHDPATKLATDNAAGNGCGEQSGSREGDE